MLGMISMSTRSETATTLTRSIQRAPRERLSEVGVHQVVDKTITSNQPSLERWFPSCPGHDLLTKHKEHSTASLAGTNLLSRRCRARRFAVRSDHPSPNLCREPLTEIVQDLV